MDKVLRASKAGFPCARSLWYSVNQQGEATIPTKTQRIFDVGTALEPVIVEWLRSDGWTVEYNPGSQNAEIEISIPVHGGIIAGHPDCIISRGEIQNALIDIKTMNERAFTHWKRQGTLKTKPQYVTQLHIYAMGLVEQGRKVDKLGIVGVNKNNSDMHIDFFDFDESTYLDIISRAETVFNANEPQSLDTASESWACNYCEFAGRCEHDREPFIRPEPDLHDKPPEAPVTDDEVIISAMRALQNARELSKQARELEAEAKTVLDENIKGKGLFGIQGGGLVLSVTERPSMRFDSKAFKEEHPDLAGQYIKNTTSITYTIKEDKKHEEMYAL